MITFLASVFLRTMMRAITGSATVMAFWMLSSGRRKMIFVPIHAPVIAVMAETSAILRSTMLFLKYLIAETRFPRPACSLLQP